MALQVISRHSTQILVLTAESFLLPVLPPMLSDPTTVAVRVLTMEIRAMRCFNLFVDKIHLMLVCLTLMLRSTRTHCASIMFLALMNMQNGLVHHTMMFLLCGSADPELLATKTWPWFRELRTPLPLAT